MGCTQSPAPTDKSDGRAVAAVSAAADAGPKRPIELFSWWARVGESDAFGALMRVHQQKYPADILINATAELSGLARKTLKNRMLRNEPPETFQANVGTDLMQWVFVNGLDGRESKLAPLDELLPAEVKEWRKVMPAALIDEVTYDGKLYAVPSNVHRINTVFYNKHVFAKYGLREPESIEDLFAIGDKLHGTGISALAFGTREPWTLALLAFECLLIASEGANFYREYFHGHARADDPRIVAVLDKTIRLMSLANPDHSRLSWLQSLELVVRGRAAMLVMGDWARVSFEAHAQKLGVDYGQFAFPGSQGTVVFTSDTFPIPVQAKNKLGAARLLRTIGSLDGQLAMSRARSSLSARNDVPIPNDPALQESRRLLETGPAVMALSGLLPPRVSDDLSAALGEMIAESDPEPVLHTLRSRYALLK